MHAVETESYRAGLAVDGEEGMVESGPGVYYGREGCSADDFAEGVAGGVGGLWDGLVV